MSVLPECMSCTMYTSVQEGEKTVSDLLCVIKEDSESSMWMLEMEPESSAR